MNKTEERRYAELLALEHAGHIAKGSILYEEVKFRLGKACFYTPDFLYVRTSDMRAVVEEIKGDRALLSKHEDGLIKWKVAAERFGHLFHFKMLIARKKKEGGGWETRE